MSEGRISLSSRAYGVSAVARLAGIDEQRVYHVRSRIPQYRLGRMIGDVWRFSAFDAIRLRSAYTLVDQLGIGIEDALLIGEHVVRRAKALARITIYETPMLMHCFPASEGEGFWETMFLPSLVDMQSETLKRPHIVFAADKVVGDVLQAIKDEEKRVVDGRTTRWRDRSISA